MLVFDDRSQLCRGHDLWSDLCAETHPTDRLINFGIIESAIADALCPERDDWHPLLVRLRRVAEHLGAEAAAQWNGLNDVRERAGREATREIATLHDERWPDVRVKMPEGYAYYALYPETYADAAARWADAARPVRVVCLGLRSIGTSLSAIVAGALRLRNIDVATWTLRPRGHPFERRVDLSPELVAALQPAASTVLIVDEGPGLSGSSMTGAAAAVSALGVTDDRIVFMPSWDPAPDRFVSRTAAARWHRHARVVPAFDAMRAVLAREHVVPANAVEISAGRWRAWLDLPQPWPAAHPQHERRKFVSIVPRGTSAGSEQAIARFAGLGRHGRESCRRAGLLADAGWSAAPLAFDRGFLTLTVAEGHPMRAAAASGDFVQHAARYLAWLRTHASAGDTACTTALAEMLRVNTREALGDEYLAAADALSRQAAAFDEPETRVDGRLMPHEWIATPHGWLKTDALDHHRDHFFPGCADVAWDIAGLAAEFDLDRQAIALALAEYVRRTGDRAIGRRLPFYSAAYLAFRVGYSAMAAETLAGTAEGPRFQALDERYRALLRATLASARTQDAGCSTGSGPAPSAR